MRAEVLEQALAQLQMTTAAVRLAQADYDKVAYRDDVGATPQALALERATLTQAAAQANYDALVKGPTTPELDQARAGVDQAQAGIIQASAAVSQTEVRPDQRFGRAARRGGPVGSNARPARGRSKSRLPRRR